MITVNGSTYFDISLLTFGIASIVIYLILKVLSRLFTYRNEREYKVRVLVDDNIIELEGLTDSGNKLTDYLTGKSVIICPKSKFSGNIKVMRLLPYSTVNSEGFVNIIKPDKLEIIYADETVISPDALVGLSNENKTDFAIVNPSLLC